MPLHLLVVVVLFLGPGVSGIEKELRCDSWWQYSHQNLQAKRHK